ncbi:unnamed protein product [Adineta steineri]|uniref:F-box domain-containing protein n=1 Tax=Adineta steineri TaxID=433720 RepID=A0A814YAM5_9BILA|nr:unnamed protein product [Adineta steineri]CAF1326109.1 unnamed protein product [Adineta steineri]
MNFESLANELLLDIFDYYYVIDLLRTFFGLNIRINNLIGKYFQSRVMDFRSMSKHDFDIICRDYLPSFFDSVSAIHLSDDGATPHQLFCFLSHNISFHQFTHLRSLTLHCGPCKSVQKSILSELCHLSSDLTDLSLTFDDKPYFHSEESILPFVNSIWSLPNLTKCYLCIEDLPVSTIVSLSLTDLTIKRGSYSLDKISLLFKHTPHLKNLTIPSVQLNPDNQIELPVVPSLNMLNTIFIASEENMVAKFVEKMPNLCHLTFRTFGLCIDGHQLEKIIGQNLPNLKVLEFRMSLTPDRHLDIKTQVDRLLEPFQNPFWIDEHRWFIQCHWISSMDNVYLYTLPYAFDYFDFHQSLQSKSTLIYDDDFYQSYNHVHDLIVHSPSEQNGLDLINIRFNNVRYLLIDSLLNNHFLSIIPNLNHLVYLDITIFNNDPRYKSQLQNLLNRAPRLYSLRFGTGMSPSKFCEKLVINLRSSSVRRLILRDVRRQWYNNLQCALLSHSSLGEQCEILEIDVENETCIYDLVDSMVNLRALYVRSWITSANSATANAAGFVPYYDNNEVIKTFVMITDEEENADALLTDGTSTRFFDL